MMISAAKNLEMARMLNDHEQGKATINISEIDGTDLSVGGQGLLDVHKALKLLQEAVLEIRTATAATYDNLKLSEISLISFREDIRALHEDASMGIRHKTEHIEKLLSKNLGPTDVESGAAMKGHRGSMTERSLSVRSTSTASSSAAQSLSGMSRAAMESSKVMAKGGGGRFKM